MYDIMAGIKAGLVPNAINRIKMAFERDARRKKRAMAMLGINEEMLAMMRRMRAKTLEQCVFYGHQWQAGVYPDRIVCVRCGKFEDQ